MTKIQVRKQFTTTNGVTEQCFELFSIWRRYKFESNSQQKLPLSCQSQSCFQYDEDTSSKAIHNCPLGLSKRWVVVFNMTKIQVRKQFTTISPMFCRASSLFSIWRRYKFESNSQPELYSGAGNPSCFQYDEDTSSKAIHNSSRSLPSLYLLFSIWRRYKFESNSQLSLASNSSWVSCFQYDEDTSSKAIHNSAPHRTYPSLVVFNMTKIQVRKQFTTVLPVVVLLTSLFSIWRRYKFESNSQLCFLL